MSKKINLAAVSARASLYEEAKEINLAKPIGNAIYVSASTIPAARFGVRLFDSTGEIEVSEEEIKLIRDALPTLVVWAREAVTKIIGD